MPTFHFPPSCPQMSQLGTEAAGTIGYEETKRRIKEANTGLKKSLELTNSLWKVLHRKVLATLKNAMGGEQQLATAEQDTIAPSSLLKEAELQSVVDTLLPHLEALQQQIETTEKDFEYLVAQSESREILLDYARFVRFLKSDADLANELEDRAATLTRETHLKSSKSETSSIGKSSATSGASSVAAQRKQRFLEMNEKEMVKVFSKNLFRLPSKRPPPPSSGESPQVSPPDSQLLDVGRFAFSFSSNCHTPSGIFCCSLLCVFCRLLGCEPERLKFLFFHQ